MFGRMVILSLVLLWASPVQAEATIVEDASVVLPVDTEGCYVECSTPAAASVEVEHVVPAEPVPTTQVPKWVQPETEAEASAAVTLWWQAFNSQAWPVVVGISIMLLVWGFRKFGLKLVSTKWSNATPLVAAGLGVLSCVGISLASGTMIWWKALLDGVASGIIASGSWELFGKHTLRKSKKPTPAAELVVVEPTVVRLPAVETVVEPTVVVLPAETPAEIPTTVAPVIEEPRTKLLTTLQSKASTPPPKRVRVTKPKAKKA